MKTKSLSFAFFLCTLFLQTTTWAGLSLHSNPRMDRDLSYPEFVQIVKLTKVYVGNAYKILPKALPGSPAATEYSALDKNVFDKLLESTRFYPTEGFCFPENISLQIVNLMPNSDVCFSYLGFKNNFNQNSVRDLLIAAITTFSSNLGLEIPTRAMLSFDVSIAWPKVQDELAKISPSDNKAVNLDGGPSGPGSHSFTIFETFTQTWPAMSAMVYSSFIRVSVLRRSEGLPIRSSALALVASVPMEHLEYILQHSQVITKEGPCPTATESFGVSMSDPFQACISYENLRGLSDEEFSRDLHIAMVYAMNRLIGLDPRTSRVFAVEYHYGDPRYLQMELILQQATSKMLEDLEKEQPNIPPPSDPGIFVRNI